MDLSREHFRAIIFYNFRRGLSPQECFNEMKSIIGDEIPTARTIYNWFKQFKRGRLSLSDESREGRPKTAVVTKNIDAVRELIKQDSDVTYREIEEALDISATSVHSILHQHLDVEKLPSKRKRIETDKKPKK